MNLIKRFFIYFIPMSVVVHIGDLSDWAVGTTYFYIFLTAGIIYWWRRSRGQPKRDRQPMDPGGSPLTEEERNPRKHGHPYW